MELKNLDKINEAKESASGIRDNLIVLGNSGTGQMSNDICVVLEVALDKVLILLDEVSADMEE